MDTTKNIFKTANTLKLIKLFKYYNLKVSESNRKIKCPFKSHAQGRESTPSFYYYPDKNTFWCFGCKTGVHAVDFVTAYENCKPIEAARKIIQLFNCDDATYTDEGHEDLTDNLLLFFTKIRDLRSDINSEEFSLFLENISEKFDTLYDKYSLNDNPKALLSLIEKTDKKIKDFIIENNICQKQLF